MYLAPVIPEFQVKSVPEFSSQDPDFKFAGLATDDIFIRREDFHTVETSIHEVSLYAENVLVLVLNPVFIDYGILKLAWFTFFIDRLSFRVNRARLTGYLANLGFTKGTRGYGPPVFAVLEIIKPVNYESILLFGPGSGITTLIIGILLGIKGQVPGTEKEDHGA
jgi:hypothetical protein